MGGTMTVEWADGPLTVATYELDGDRYRLTAEHVDLVETTSPVEVTIDLTEITRF